MNKSTVFFGMIIASLAALFVRVADADPLLLLNLEGRRHGTSDPFTQQVVAGPGEVIDYVVTASTAGPGATNSHGYTVSSATLEAVNSFTVDLFDPASAPTQVNFNAPATLQNS